MMNHVNLSTKALRLQPSCQVSGFYFYLKSLHELFFLRFGVTRVTKYAETAMNKPLQRVIDKYMLTFWRHFAITFWGCLSLFLGYSFKNKPPFHLNVIAKPLICLHRLAQISRQYINKNMRLSGCTFHLLSPRCRPLQPRVLGSWARDAGLKKRND